MLNFICSGEEYEEPVWEEKYFIFVQGNGYVHQCTSQAAWPLNNAYPKPWEKRCEDKLILLSSVIGAMLKSLEPSYLKQTYRGKKKQKQKATTTRKQPSKSNAVRLAKNVRKIQKCW